MVHQPTRHGDGDARNTRVKICGVTSPADAELAVSAGAWAIGMVFHSESPRLCDPVAAAEIGARIRRRAEVVGVFVNAPLDEVVAAAENASLTMLQLHGDEGPSYCEEARRRTSLRVIKAVRVRDAGAVRHVSAYKTDFHMLDTYKPGVPGGTGERFDWALAREHLGDVPLILAGGVGPQNAREAIDVVRPFALDVSSGVETAPGLKDPQKLQRLFAAVREAGAARV
jgi:phosphoribosylanthranilate isomerase